MMPISNIHVTVSATTWEPVARLSDDMPINVYSPVQVLESDCTSMGQAAGVVFDALRGLGIEIKGKPAGLPTTIVVRQGPRIESRLDEFFTPVQSEIDNNGGPEGLLGTYAELRAYVARLEGLIGAVKS